MKTICETDDATLLKMIELRRQWIEEIKASSLEDDALDAEMARFSRLEMQIARHVPRTLAGAAAMLEMYNNEYYGDHGQSIEDKAAKILLKSVEAAIRQMLS